MPVLEHPINVYTKISMIDTQTVFGYLKTRIDLLSEPLFNLGLSNKTRLAFKTGHLIIHLGVAPVMEPLKIDLKFDRVSCDNSRLRRFAL